MSDEGLDSAKVMRIVSHPVRMRIIELLAVRPMTWKELSGEVGVRTGSLYHHLDTLERIVTRDSERRYALTPLGREIYAQLSDEKKTPAQSMQSIERAMRKRTLAGVVRDLLLPRSLIVSLTSTRVRGLCALGGVSVLVVALLLSFGDQLVLFSFSPAGSPLVTVGTYAASLIGLTAVAYLSLAVAFEERGDLVTLLSSSALSFVPLCLFGALLHLGSGTGLGSSIMGGSTALTLGFAFFQAWGAGVVGAGMSVASGLRVEKTLVVSLVVLYATELVILAQGGRIT